MSTEHLINAAIDEFGPNSNGWGTLRYKPANAEDRKAELKRYAEAAARQKAAADFRAMQLSDPTMYTSRLSAETPQPVVETPQPATETLQQAAQLVIDASGVEINLPVGERESPVGVNA